jgi:hypothetical protein
MTGLVAIGMMVSGAGGRYQPKPRPQQSCPGHRLGLYHLKPCNSGANYRASIETRAYANTQFGFGADCKECRQFRDLRLRTTNANVDEWVESLAAQVEMVGLRLPAESRQGRVLKMAPRYAAVPYGPLMNLCWTPGALSAPPTEQDNGALTHLPASRARLPPWRPAHSP